MFFNKIRGHSEILSKFKKIILDDTFSSVNLFTGPKGVGKHTISRLLAKYSLCLGVKDDTCRCGYCKQFPNIPDYLEIGSDEDSLIKVEDAESIEEFVSLRPFRNKRRVVVINNIDNIHASAANRLLKIFEDIDPNTVFINTTSNLNRILPTVRSRCEIIEFNSLSPDDIGEILKDKQINITKIDSFKKIIPYLTESVLKDGLKYNEYIKEVPSFLKKFEKGKEDELLDYLEEVQEKEEVLFFVEILIVYLNDLLKLKYDSYDSIVNIDKIDQIEDLSTEWTDDICIAFIEKLRKSMLEYKRGLNLKLHMRIRPIISWVYLLMKSNQTKNTIKFL